jgi:thiosulfate/3-mercaptopyruvate sulfurtransferase
VWKFQSSNRPEASAINGSCLSPFIDNPWIYAVPAQEGEPRSRTIPALISSDWLSSNLDTPGLTILDIRETSEYSGAHIPGSVNAPFARWITSRNQLLLEVPEQNDLMDIISAAGIDHNSFVIVVNRADNPRSLSDAARVADTLIYAGIKNVSILDGGFDLWLAGERKIADTAADTHRKPYLKTVDKNIFVPIEYVRKKTGKSLLLDARDPDVYFGLQQEPTASRPGHIPKAKNLPAPWIWEKDGTYKSKDILDKMAAGLTGNSKSKEIIIYCGVGGYASAWWYVLTQMLGYQHARIYDGSAEEWTRNPANPVTLYKWE